MFSNVGLIAIAAALVMGIGAFGAGLGLGKAVAAGLESAGRQPEALGELQTMMIIGAAMIEAIAIYCFVIAFLIQWKIPTFSLEVLAQLKP